MISIVVYDNQNGKSVKLYSSESNTQKTLEAEIASMCIILEKKIDINPMLIAKHISVTKQRYSVVVELMSYISHPEDYHPKNTITTIEKSLISSTYEGSD